MTMQVLDEYILRLKHRDRVLGEAFEFVIKQMQSIEAQQQSLLVAGNLTIPGPENLSLLMSPGKGPTLPVDDRSVHTHFLDGTQDLLQFQVGAKYYNRLEADNDYDIEGVIPVTNGQRLVFVNVSTHKITLWHLSAGAPAEYQMHCVGMANIVLLQNDMAMMWRDSESQLWRAWQL